MTNRHSVRILFLLLTWAAHLRPLLGQEPVATPHIDVAERYDFGAKIDPKFVGTALEGATAVYAWTLPEGMESERDDGPFPLLWAGKAKQGVQKIALSVTYTIQLPQIDPSDPTKLITKPFTLPPYQYSETFVLGAVPPGPVPDNPDPPPPGSLAALVPNPAHRLLLAEFYSDMAAAVRAGAYTTTPHFREGYRLAMKGAQDSGALPTGLAVIDKPVSNRIAAAISLADTPIDEAKKNALAAALDAIAAEFKW